MAIDNFLGLVNRALKPLNEVVLNSSNFDTTQGVYAEARDAVNQALYDIYTYKNVLWPFLFSELTFQTERGIIEYIKPSGVSKVDWASFTVERTKRTVTSLTRVGTTATAVTSAPHTFLTGDYVEIIGAAQNGYNTTNVPITVIDSITFTYTVTDNTLTTPATGTIIVKSNILTKKPLVYVDKDKYIKSYSEDVENATAATFTTPRYVSRKPNNSFIIFDAPDRAYDIKYSAYSVPSKLTLFSDTHLVPEQYEGAIIDKALHYMYMFRDNLEQASVANSRGDDKLSGMIRVLSPFANNMVTP
jgi:hypothetical protein